MGEEIRKEQTAEQEAGDADAAQSGTAGAEMADEAEMMARLQQEIRNLPVSDHLLYMMHSLSALAIGRMGMTPETAALRDLAQARMAIDAFKALLEILERVRPTKEMTAHRSALSELQLAYVAAVDRGAPGHGKEQAGATGEASALAGEADKARDAEREVGGVDGQGEEATGSGS